MTRPIDKIQVLSSNIVEIVPKTDSEKKLSRKISKFGNLVNSNENTYSYEVNKFTKDKVEILASYLDANIIEICLPRGVGYSINGSQYTGCAVYNKGDALSIHGPTHTIFYPILVSLILLISYFLVISYHKFLSKDLINKFNKYVNTSFQIIFIVFAIVYLRGFADRLNFHYGFFAAASPLFVMLIFLLSSLFLTENLKYGQNSLINSASISAVPHNIYLFSIMIMSMYLENGILLSVGSIGTYLLLNTILGLIVLKNSRPFAFRGSVEVREVNMGTMPFALAMGLTDNKIYLSKFIISMMSREELEAIISHEFAHLKFKHQRLLSISVFIASMIYTTAFSITSVYIKAICVFVIFMSFRFLSRKTEFAADKDAALQYRDSITTALEKMREHTPKHLEIFSTHPSIEKRIKAIKNEL